MNNSCTSPDSYNETQVKVNVSSTEPFLLEFNPYMVPVNGYLSPALVLLTIVTNVFVCAVLLKPNMRSSTNTLLVAMAVSDMLTGVCPIPCYVYFFSWGHYADYVPYRWCFAYYCLTDFLPTTFHTASIWLTVALAVQRYIYVCHSLEARRWCTVSNAIRVAFFIYAVAILSQISRFLEVHYIPLLVKSRLEPETTIVSCRYVYSQFIGDNLNVYFNVYYWFRVIFIHLVPCTALVFMNAILVQTMRVAQTRRQQLLKQNRRTESRRLAESNVTTMMLVAVVGVFLVVEFPLAILFIVMIVENIEDRIIMDPMSASVASLFINFFILVSYPLNFFIYCGMSRQFRETLKSLFRSGSQGLGTSAECSADPSKYASMAILGSNSRTYDAYTTTVKTEVAGSDSLRLL